MAKSREKASTEPRHYSGRHLGTERSQNRNQTAGDRTEWQRSSKKQSSAAEGERSAARENGRRRESGRRPEAVKRAEAPSVRRPARPGQRQGRTPGAAGLTGQIDAGELYRHFVPHIESAHHRNERSLKAGLWLLVLLPAVLVLIQELTDASRIVFLIIWIIGMFGIATALIFTAYADHDLKKTLRELKEIVPPEEEFELGSLLPVDAEGEGWLINPEDLPIPLPDLAERLPQRRKALEERIEGRKTARRQAQEERHAERRQRRESRQDREALRGRQEKTAEDTTEIGTAQRRTGGKHLKQEK